MILINSHLHWEMFLNITQLREKHYDESRKISNICLGYWRRFTYADNLDLSARKQCQDEMTARHNILERLDSYILKGAPNDRRYKRSTITDVEQQASLPSVNWHFLIY